MFMINHNLRLFAAVADEGNITDAAKKLYISQPSVSLSLKKLETELSLKLFYRNKKGVVLTDAGKDVLLMTRQMLDLENRINQYSYDWNHLKEGILRIAAVPLAITHVLAPILPIYKRKYPDIQIELWEKSSIEVRKMVEDYQVDLGFGTSPYKGLDHIVLLQDQIVSISREAPSEINLYKTDRPLIFCSNSHEAVLDKLNQQNISIHDKIIVEMPISLLHMVKNGIGIGIMSKTLFKQYNMEGLYIGKIDPLIENDISIISRDLDELSPSARMLKDIIVKKEKLS